MPSGEIALKPSSASVSLTRESLRERSGPYTTININLEELSVFDPLFIILFTIFGSVFLGINFNSEYTNTSNTFPACTARYAYTAAHNANKA
ncbi:MAG: hypothetical protein AT715_06010 [Thermoproteus sp. JCHS_4]|jgi:hypothetical protein|nr:MAG: hypothetical protein AT715_06010 [Thermoproteus sp. JCHS_4]